MPTAHEFDQAARAFERAADTAEALLRGTRDRLGPEVLRGGSLTLITTLTIDTAERMGAQLTIDCRAHATTCRERAKACRLYAAQLADHRRAEQDWSRTVNLAANAPELGLTIPPRPRPPRRPHSWIEI